MGIMLSPLKDPEIMPKDAVSIGHVSGQSPGHESRIQRRLLDLWEGMPAVTNYARSVVANRHRGLL